MQLDDAQKQQVAAWLNEGLSLAEIQTRLEREFGLRLTYFDVKLLVSELAVLPKDPEPATEKTLKPAPAPASEAPQPASPASPVPPAPEGAPAPEPAPAGGRVSVTVDQVARPGALVSGQVTFSDGQTGAWYVDDLGRLGLMPAQHGYRPSRADMQDFQQALDRELARMGI